MFKYFTTNHTNKRAKVRGKQSLLIALLFFAVLSCNEPVTTPQWLTAAQESPQTWSTAQPLHEIYKNYFMMGNIIRSAGDFTDAARSGILKRHYNIVTAENDMKPDHLAPAGNSAPASDNWNYRFVTADQIVNNAVSAGFKVHGHTLIWHSQSPAWLANGREPYLNKFVSDVVTHFKGRVISWDVVNEALRDGLSEGDAANWKNCLRYDDAPWNKSIGPDYIEKAFRAARRADPDAKLYYNDYSLNSAGKSRATYNMVKEINDKWRSEGNSRLLIEGIGMQSHHHLNTDPQTIDTAINLFSSLGVEIAISEMDIQAAAAGTNNLTDPWSDAVERRQAEHYAAMFKIFRKYRSNVSRVVFWGLDDGASWRSASRPTLLNSNYTLKLAFYAVSNP